MLDTAVRHFCRNPRCRQKLAQPVESPRKAFCSRGCHASFYRSRCLVCERELERGPANRKLCKRASCKAELRRFSHVYTFEGAPKPPSTENAQRPLRSPAKSGPETRGGSDRGSSLDLARLPLDRHTAARLARANDPARLRRETAWGHAEQLKPIFGPDALPLNVVGGHQFPGAPHVAHVIPRSRAARTPTVEAKADSDALDIPASLVRRPAP